MSFFYLFPAKGEIQFHILEDIVEKRIKYFTKLQETIDYNEYIVEGSVYDNIGHFMLSMISVLGENKEFILFVLNSEVKLFKHRLQSLSTYELRAFAKRLLKSVKKVNETLAFYEPLQTLCEHLLPKYLAQHICISHNKNCNTFSLQLHFKHCLGLLSKRQVELKNGIVSLPCSLWKDFLVCIFKTNLQQRLKTSNKLKLLQVDPRLSDLISKIQMENSLQTGLSTSFVLLSKDVDAAAVSFPPCMQNLHKTLRRKHRLSHTQRFYYSLFLKDIGMKVQEAVEFWKFEYSQSPNDAPSCCHNWESDDKKYLYGIRHMYGLEGARKNYTSVCCSKIQGTENACSEGGCPFKSFDEIKFMQVVQQNCSKNLLLEINELRNKKQYTSACQIYLHKRTCDISTSFTPLNYYLLAKEKSKLIT